MSEYIYASCGEPLANYSGEILFAREEVVRCMNCTNSSFDKFGRGRCSEDCREIKSWDYCSWGERRDK